MPKLKVLSGRSIQKMLGSFGFVVVGIKGSHLRMRLGSVGITVPLHKEVSKGTLKQMYRDLVGTIVQKDLDEMFYTK
jgi:predicted RNA binding protein YcfA (HicA-like mRNA interferase family)